MSSNYRMLVIDDEVMLTNLLAQHFQMLGYLVWTANNYQQAMEQVAHNPDIILLDINMPDMDGVTFCKEIREQVSCPILFLTARVQEVDKIVGLSAGGDDYITKPFSLDELTARVQAHLRREQRRATKGNVFTAGELIINVSEQSISHKGEVLVFSKKEFELICYLAQHPDYVLSREHIYEAVWGYDAEGDSGVIKEHVRKIRQKLKTQTGRDYIETVWGMGYCWKNK